MSYKKKKFKDWVFILYHENKNIQKKGEYKLQWTIEKQTFVLISNLPADYLPQIAASVTYIGKEVKP